MPKVLTAATIPGAAAWTDADALTAGLSSIIYRPAGPQDTTLGIYTTFAAALAAAQALVTATERPIRLYLEDPPDGGPLTLAAIDYDFMNLIIPTGFANEQSAVFVIETVEGTTFSNFALGAENVDIVHLGTATALITVDPGSLTTLPHRLGPNSSITASDSAAPVYDFVESSPGQTFELSLFENSGIVSFGPAALRAVIDGTIEVSGGCLIYEDNISSNGVPGTTISINASGNFNWSSTQTEFLGEISVSTSINQSTALAGAAPASGVPVVNPTGPDRGRVFGTFTLAATGVNAASWIIEIQTAPGSGYTTIGTFTQVATDTLPRTYWFYFEITPGAGFRFTRGGLAGVTETISNYNSVLNS